MDTTMELIDELISLGYYVEFRKGITGTEMKTSKIDTANRIRHNSVVRLDLDMLDIDTLDINEIIDKVVSDIKELENRY